MYVLTALQMGTSGFFYTARTAILPDITSPRALGTANALTAATWSVMLAVGAALGGFAAGWLGVYAAFTIDAMTFLVSAVLVAQIRRPAKKAGNERLSLAAAARKYFEGLGYLRRHPDILGITLHKAALTMLLGSTFRVVQSTVAERVFPVGQQGGISMGLMFAMAGVGTGVGPLVMRFFTRDREVRLRWAIVFGYVLGGLGLFFSAQLVDLPTMLWASFLAGLGNGMIWVFSTQLLLQLVEASVRGRVIASEFAMFALTSAVGCSIVGVGIDSRLGISGVLLSMAAATLIPAIAWSGWLLVRRRLGEELERPAG